MAITSAGDLDGIMNASATIGSTITGVKRVYERLGEIPPADDAANLPAIVQTATAPDLPPGRIVTLNNHLAFDHYWFLDLVVAREGDLYDEQTDVLPFIDLVPAKYRTNFNLGNRVIIDRCFPQTYRFVIISAGTQAFFAVRFLMHCRAKTAADYTDPN